MGYLNGFQEYLDEKYALSIFDHALESKQPWVFHLHKHRIIKALIVENLVYDIILKHNKTTEETLQKTDVKILYPTNHLEIVPPLLKTDKEVKGLDLEPILPPSKRHHIKNKTLFPLMKEKRVLFFTLMEGEVVRGILADFSRYEITLGLKGGIPVTIFRHSIYDVRDKKGRCFLKSFQEDHRDWEKSELFIIKNSDH